MKRKNQCPFAGCNEEVVRGKFLAELGVEGPGAERLRKKPIVVYRLLQGTCPVHGPVTVAVEGTHLTLQKPPPDSVADERQAIGFVLDEPWQAMVLATILGDWRVD